MILDLLVVIAVCVVIQTVRGKGSARGARPGTKHYEVEQRPLRERKEREHAALSAQSARMKRELREAEQRKRERERRKD